MQSMFSGNPLSYLVCLSKCSRKPSPTPVTLRDTNIRRPADDIEDLSRQADTVEISSHPTMVNLKLLIDAIVDNDMAKVNQVVTETRLDLDSQDEQGKTALHHAIGLGNLHAASCLINHGADVNCKDETAQHETPLHTALRLGNIESVKLVLEAASFDVVKCDSLHPQLMFPELLLTTNDVMCTDSQPVMDDDFRKNSNLIRRHNRKQLIRTATDDCTGNNDVFPIAQSIVVRRDATNCLLDAVLVDGVCPVDLIVVQDDDLTDYGISRVLMRIGYTTLTSLCIVDCPHAKLDDGVAEMLASGGGRLRSLVLSRTGQRCLPAAVFRITTLETLKVDRNRLTSIPADIGQLSALKVFCCDGQHPRGLRTLPSGAMRALTMLEILSFGSNRIESIDDWIASLDRLRVLLCSRNRISRLPVGALSRLKQLRVVNIRHNRIGSCSSSFCASSMTSSSSNLAEFIHLIDNVRHFSCDQMSILAALEVGGNSSPVGQQTQSSISGYSHQRFRGILMCELKLRQHLLSVVNHVSSSGGISVGGAVREITVAVVGATHVGKATLVEALSSDRGVSSATQTESYAATSGSTSSGRRTGNGDGSSKLATVFDVRHFEIKPEVNSSSSMTPVTCFVSAIVISNDLSFRLLANRCHVDLFLLVVDLASFDAASVCHSANPDVSGSRHGNNNTNSNSHNNHRIHQTTTPLKPAAAAADGRPNESRTITRLRMWLGALGETAPNTPVLLVGTHAADLAQQQSVNGSIGGVGGDIWREVCDVLLEPARREHAKQYTRLPNCVLCSPTVTSDLRQSYAGTCGTSSNTTWTGHGTSKMKHPSTAGYVDLSRQSDRSIPIATNGYTLSMNPSSRDCDDVICRTAAMELGGRYTRFANTLRDRSLLPHIVGYYELESVKSFPKDVKPRGASYGSGGAGTNGHGHATVIGNPSIDHLKSAIVRLTQSRSESWTGSSSTMNLVPLSWARFVRHLESIVEQEPMLTCLPLPEVVAIARSFDMSPTEAYRALVYFERRGQLFVGGGAGPGGISCTDEVDLKSRMADAHRDDCDVMSKVVVISISWLFKTIARVLDSLDSSIIREREITSILASDSPIGRDLDRQLSRAGLTTPPSRSQWLLGTLKSFDMCLPIGHGSVSLGLPLLPSTTSQAYLFPALLETGTPTESIWPENPNCDEKQVTCDATVRRQRPGMFSGLQRQLASADGVRQMAIVTSLPLVFMSHHVIFSTSFDGGSCSECFHIRRRCRPDRNRSRPQHVAQTPGQTPGCDEGIAFIPPPAGYADERTVDDAVYGCSSVNSSTNIIHRVHMELGSNLDFVRIQVRGVSPCCVMRSVVDFIDLHLDDFRLSTTQNADILPPPYSSLNIDDVSCVSSTTARVEPQPITVSVNGRSPPTPGSTINGRSSTGLGCQFTPSSYSRSASRCASKGSVRYHGASVGGGVSPSDAGDLDDDDDGCGSGDQLQSDDDPDDGIDERRRLYVVCPKCILLRTVNPERIEYPSRATRVATTTSSSSSSSSGTRRRKPICRKWHNLGSWARVVTGDYRPTLRGLDGSVSLTPGGLPSIVPTPISTTGLFLNGAALPDHEHPRLVLILPPGERLSTVDWYVFSRPRFIDGFDIHFLCEYTGYWHFVNDGGVEFRLGGNGPTSAASNASPAASTTTYRGRRPGCLGMEHQLPGALLRMAIPIIQCLRGVGEHTVNARMLAPVVGDLLDVYEGSGGGPAGQKHRGDPSAWLVKHRDKLASMLTKVLLGAFYSETSLTGGHVAAEIYNKCSTPISADSAFNSSFSRSSLARFLRVDASTSTGGGSNGGAGRFGGLRPVMIGREVRWVCRAHFDELKSVPTSPSSSASIVK